MSAALGEGASVRSSSRLHPFVLPPPSVRPPASGATGKELNLLLKNMSLVCLPLHYRYNALTQQSFLLGIDLAFGPKG